MDYRKGFEFTHASWVEDLHSMKPVRCVVTAVTEKKITFRPVFNRSDLRVGSCKPREFPSMVKQA